jgi:hypothetical protein
VSPSYEQSVGKQVVAPLAAGDDELGLLEKQRLVVVAPRRAGAIPGSAVGGQRRRLPNL